MTRKQLRDWRLARGMTQTELARALGMTKPETSGKVRVNRWESGARGVPTWLDLALRGLDAEA